MPGSLKGLQLQRLLLGGWDLTTSTTANATALDADLEAAGNLGAFKLLLTYPQIRATLIADGLARPILARSSAALGVLLNYYPGEVLENAEFYALLNTIVNDGTHYLLRSAILSGASNWTPHANGIWACYALLQAPGGNGGNGNATAAGAGGAGGETVGHLFPEDSVPTGAVAYSVGAVGSNTTFGSLTALKGGNGAAAPGQTATTTGPGTTTNGGADANLASATPTTDGWHKGSFHHAGGNGGAGPAGTGGDGVNGGDGATGTGGEGGTAGNGVRGKAGTGLGSGGGGGRDDAGTTGTLTGESAAANSGCGAGGGTDDSGPGGSGGTGGIWVWSVKKRAA